jgi:formate dehydrogenase maturation protein FdhE
MIEITNCPVCGSSSLNSFIKTTAQMHSNKELFNFDECSSCDLVFLNPRLHFLLFAISKIKSLVKI